MKIGIMAAMPEEITAIKLAIENASIEVLADREYISGELNGVSVVLVHSRWGKVASAITATTLILNNKVDAIIFTGVAGSISDAVNIGDIVIGSHLFQHDMDARPFFENHHIPIVNKKFFESNQQLVVMLQSHAASSILKIPKHDLLDFSISRPKVHVGIIASGDKFIKSIEDSNKIKTETAEVLAVEMEGAAVAQVCEEHTIAFAIMRTISDNADHKAQIDFIAFIKKIASIYSFNIMFDAMNNIRILGALEE